MRSDAGVAQRRRGRYRGACLLSCSALIEANDVADDVRGTVTSKFPTMMGFAKGQSTCAIRSGHALIETRRTCPWSSLSYCDCWMKPGLSMGWFRCRGRAALGFRLTSSLVATFTPWKAAPLFDAHYKPSGENVASTWSEPKPVPDPVAPLLLLIAICLQLEGGPSSTACAGLGTACPAPNRTMRPTIASPSRWNGSLIVPSGQVGDKLRDDPRHDEVGRSLVLQRAWTSRCNASTSYAAR